MSDEILERYIAHIFDIHGSDAIVEFAWHGGEPTLCGIDFFEKAILYQTKYGAGRKICNTLQTNGTTLTDRWCDFFVRNHFLIGVSIDGPKELHDYFRKDASGGGSFDRVMNGIKLLKKHGVEFNTLTTVNSANSQKAEAVYDFLCSISDHMQFLPVVECCAIDNMLSIPPGVHSNVGGRKLSSSSVFTTAYGNFLCAIFDRWKSRDVGAKFIQIFESTIGNILGRHAGLCVHESVCGHCGVVEHDGRVYSCDRYVYDQYCLGDITSKHLGQLMDKNRDFGMHKLDALPSACLHCEVVQLCWGGCPKDRHRITMNYTGVSAENYLCPSYKLFFNHFRRNITDILPNHWQ